MTMLGTQPRLAITMPRFSRYGGAESFAWRLAEALAAKGYPVDFICGRCETEPPVGVTPVVVGRFGGFRVVKILWFAYASARARKKGRYDLVFGLGKTVGQDIMRVGGGPITTFWKLSQRAWPEGFPRSFKMLRRRLSPANWVIRILDGLRFGRTPKIVAVSHLVREWIVEAHPALDKDSIEVIYNKPDLSRFSPPTEAERATLRAEADIAPGAVVVATAATNFALKGVRYLIDCLTRLPEHYVLHVAGGRNPSRYVAQAERLGVAHRVRFLGRVEDMASFYQRTDVFILATFYDACSNAVLEALASGCKVLSSRLNGSARFLSEAMVFPDPADVEDMAARIGQAAEAPRPGPFAWPDDIRAGLEHYVAMIERAVIGK